MSLRMLQKQAGVATSESSQAAKKTTQTSRQCRNSGSSGGSGGQGGHYYGGEDSSAGNETRSSGGGFYASGAGDPGQGGFYGSNSRGKTSYYAKSDDTDAGGNSARDGGYYASSARGAGASSSNNRDGGYHASSAAGVGGGSSVGVMAPRPVGRFVGSDAQRSHVESMRKANQAAVAVSPMPVAQEVAVKSHLGLDVLRERKQREEEQRQAKREAARAKRHDETSKREVEDDAALSECEEQAKCDADENDRVKYEAALIVRIAVRFGTAGVWVKIAEARARGAEIPLDPRRIYLLAHPDKCPLQEASDATAILNAQRPPEMTEIRARPARPATNAASSNPVRDQVAPCTDTCVDPVAPVPPSASNSEEHVERRKNPEDGQTCTLVELQAKYKGIYLDVDILTYWNLECVPVSAAPVCVAAAQTEALPAVNSAKPTEPTVIKPKVAGSRRF